MIPSLLLAPAAVGTPERFLEPIPIERVKLRPRVPRDARPGEHTGQVPPRLNPREETGRHANLDFAADATKGGREEPLYDGSDVYQTIEAIRGGRPSHPIDPIASTFGSS
jgi:hypothetical protein